MTNKDISDTEVIKPQKTIEVDPRIGFAYKTQIKIFEMVGTILQKEVVKNTQGKYAGKYYVNLTVRLQTPKYSHINRLFMAPEKAKNQLMVEDILNNRWVDKKYVFKTTRTSRFHANNFWIVDWDMVSPVVKKEIKTKTKK